MPHIIQLSSLVFAFQVRFRHVFEFLTWLITRELDCPSTVLRYGLLLAIIVWQGKCVGVVRAGRIGVIDDSIDVRSWGIKSSSDLLPTLFDLFLRFWCFLLLESHVFYLHDIIIFFLNQTILFLFKTCFGRGKSFLAFKVILLHLSRDDIVDWFCLWMDVQNILLFHAAHSRIFVLFEARVLSIWIQKKIGFLDVDWHGARSHVGEVCCRCLMGFWVTISVYLCCLFYTSYVNTRNGIGNIVRMCIQLLWVWFLELRRALGKS